MPDQRLVPVARHHSLALLLAQKTHDERDKVHALAESYCAEKKVGARACLTTNPAWAKVISKTSLNRRLSEEVVTGKEHSSKWLLTKTDDIEMAASLEAAGKQNACFDKDERNQLVINILLHRQARNKKGGRAFRKLSRPASIALKRGKAGRKFWRKFFIRHKDIIHITKEKVTSILRLYISTPPEFCGSVGMN